MRSVISVHSVIKGISNALCIGILSLFLASCNGGGDDGGGFTGTADTIRVSIHAAKTDLPANLNNEPPSLVLPFTTSVMVRVEQTDGTTVANGTDVQLAVDGVRHGAISTLDDPATEDINEFIQLMGNTTAQTASGQAQFFFTSFDQPGVTTLTASVQDPVSGKTINRSIQMTVGGGVSTGKPAQVLFLSSNSPLFVQGLGGETNKIVQTLVLDEAGQPVPNPAPGIDNLRIELLPGGPNAGEKLLGVSASGIATEGSAILVPTNNGIAQFSLMSGTLPGSVALQATADRDDNNVNDGITGPIRNASALSIVTAFSDEPLNIATETLPVATANVFYAALLAGEGGVAPYTWSVQSGSLPPGITLEPSGVLLGTPTQSGEFTFILQLQGQEADKTATRLLTLNVQPPQGPQITTTALLDGRRDVSYSDILTATGGAFPLTWSITAGTLPPGLSLNSASGAISGTPTTPGSFSFVVSVTDANGVVAFAPFKITIDTPDVIPDPDDPPSLSVNSIQLLSSSPQLPSAGTETVTLTAVAKDVNNVVVEGASVVFSADNDGTLQVTRATTDETGTAQATLSTAGNKDNRIINVTASVGALSDTTTVQVAGTHITVSGADSAVLGDPVTLTLTLKDSAGVGIMGKTLTIDSALGNTLSSSTVTTGSNGQATVTVTATVGGTDTITVSGAGASVSHSLAVSTDSFAFTVPLPSPSPIQEVPLNTSFTVTVRWTSAEVPIVGQPVNFSATRGTLSPSNALTDANGEASVSISADNAGPSVITASAAGGPSAQIEILFVATDPSSMTLQASPATVGTNPPGGSGEQSVITAVIRDANNNPVKGKTIQFTLTDITGGSISPSAAVTDAFGRASTVYTAGTIPSAQNGVTVDATVTGTEVKNTVFLTVARKELFITLGTGNLITDLDNTRYAKPYNVLITDADGAPIANATVTLSIVPTFYYKGYYKKPSPTLPWEQVITSPACANEDINGNGILDPGEDFNNNDRLDPGNVVTLSAATVTTDASGFALFDVIYAKQFAQWVDVRLTARTSVFGSEATESANFGLPIAAADVASTSSSPPGNPSPFGTSPTCSDTL